VSNPSPWPALAGDRAELLVITRHQVGREDRATFLEKARLALATLAEHAGYEAGYVAQSTDDPDEFVLQTRWSDVGAFRRALSSFDVKLNAVPLLSTAVDHTSAFEVVVSRTTSGETLTSSGLADDAGDVGLGGAAGPVIPSATP
jgi:quinol monooxygenase YgiN